MTTEASVAKPKPTAHGQGAPSWWERTLPDIALAGVMVALCLPVLWMGYGTDIDVHNVLRATEVIRSGSYEPSRTPGVPVFEVIVTVLDPVGGHLLVNLATTLAAAMLVVGVARLVRAWGHDNGDLVALAFTVSPVTIIAGAGLADFIWALTFLVWGALVHLRSSERPRPAGTPFAWAWGWNLLAGALFALAIGSRLSTSLLVGAFLLADGWDPARRWRCVRTAVITGPLGAAMFIPSWLAFDRSLAFLESSEGWRGLFSNLGLLAYKNYTFAGVALIVVLAGALPALWRALRGWSQDPMLRFGVLGVLGTEALYFQYPWKLAHLLPALLGVLLWLGASAWGRQRSLLWLVVGAVAVNGLVTFRLLAPDQPDEAQSGSWNPAISLGLLANDIHCRSHYMHLEPTKQNSEDAWACTIKPIRGNPTGVAP